MLLSFSGLTAEEWAEKRAKYCLLTFNKPQTNLNFQVSEGLGFAFLYTKYTTLIHRLFWVSVGI